MLDLRSGVALMPGIKGRREKVKTVGSKERRKNGREGGIQDPRIPGKGWVLPGTLSFLL